ncbi:MAG: T9SS type A sorting domain-containing protein [Chitinophagaceae bacterium]|nr:T9SS type A sorting domain-containing protein [Chitinophagaceae bacterium]
METITKLKSLVVLAVLLTSSHVVGQGGVVITAGNNLVASGSVYLVLNNGAITNDGVFTPDLSTVKFTGNTGTTAAFIGGGATSTFYDLMLAKSANGIQLNHNINVNHQLIFSSGDSVFLNNYILDLGTTGSLSGENNASRVTGMTGGYIRVSRVMNAPTALNPGNIGLSVTSAVNLGTVIIRRGHQQQGSASVYRYFDVIPDNNNAADATLDFYYFESELAGVGEGNLSFFTSENAGIHWRNIGEEGMDPTGNIVTKIGVDTLNRFTLANSGEPLAFSLLYLKANYQNRQVRLNWATASETDNNFFELERSSDGKQFNTLARVPGSGNSQTRQYYEYADIQPLPGINYYRLKQVNDAGRPVYSYIVAVNTSDPGSASMRVFPNPTSGNISLAFTAPAENNYFLLVNDMSGRTIQRKLIHCMQGLNQVSIDLGQMPSGIYSLRIADLDIKPLQVLKQ